MKKTGRQADLPVFNYHMEPEGKDYLNQLIEEYNSLHSGIQSILNKTKEGDELTHVQKTQ